MKLLSSPKIPAGKTPSASQSASYSIVSKCDPICVAAFIHHMFLVVASGVVAKYLWES